MKNSTDEDSTLVELIEDRVPAMFDSAKSRLDGIASTPEARPLSNTKKACNHSVEIKSCLLFAPHICRVIGNIGKIEFCQS